MNMDRALFEMFSHLARAPKGDRVRIFLEVQRWPVAYQNEFVLLVARKGRLKLLEDFRIWNPPREPLRLRTSTESKPDSPEANGLPWLRHLATGRDDKSSA